MNNLHETVFNHPFFQGMKEDHLAVLADCASDIRFKPGELLFREGEPTNQFFLIQQGKVALESREAGENAPPIQELTAGEVLGWSWLFPPFVWHFQARATELTEAVAFDGAHLLNIAEKDHDFGYELMKRVAQIVIHRLQSTRRQMMVLRPASVTRN